MHPSNPRAPMTIAPIRRCIVWRGLAASQSEAWKPWRRRSVPIHSGSLAPPGDGCRVANSVPARRSGGRERGEVRGTYFGDGMESRLGVDQPQYATAGFQIQAELPPFQVGSPSEHPSCITTTCSQSGPADVRRLEKCNKSVSLLTRCTARLSVRWLFSCFFLFPSLFLSSLPLLFWHQPQRSICTYAILDMLSSSLTFSQTTHHCFSRPGWDFICALVLSIFPDPSPRASFWTRERRGRMGIKKPAKTWRDWHRAYGIVTGRKAIRLSRPDMP